MLDMFFRSKAPASVSSSSGLTPEQRKVIEAQLIKRTDIRLSENSSAGRDSGRRLINALNELRNQHIYNQDIYDAVLLQLLKLPENAIVNDLPKMLLEKYQDSATLPESLGATLSSLKATFKF